MLVRVPLNVLCGIAQQTKIKSKVGNLFVISGVTEMTSAAVHEYYFPVRSTYVSTLFNDLKPQDGGLQVSVDQPQQEVAQCLSAPPSLQPFFKDQETAPSGKNTLSPSSQIVSNLHLTSLIFQGDLCHPVTLWILDAQKSNFLPHVAWKANGNCNSCSLSFTSFFILLQEVCPSLDVLFSPLSPASIKTASSSPNNKVWLKACLIVIVQNEWFVHNPKSVFLLPAGFSAFWFDMLFCITSYHLTASAHVTWWCVLWTLHTVLMCSSLCVSVLRMQSTKMILLTSFCRQEVRCNDCLFCLSCNHLFIYFFYLLSNLMIYCIGSEHQTSRLIIEILCFPPSEMSSTFKPAPDSSLDHLNPNSSASSPPPSPLHLLLSPPIAPSCDTPQSAPSVQSELQTLADTTEERQHLCNAGSGRLEDFLESTTGKPLLGVEPGGLLIDDLHSQLLCTPSILDHPPSPMDIFDMALEGEQGLDSMEWLDLTTGGERGEETPTLAPLGPQTPPSVFSTDFLDSYDLQIHWDSCL